MSMYKTQIFIEALMNGGLDSKTAHMVAEIHNAIYEDVDDLAEAIASIQQNEKPNIQSAANQKQETPQQSNAQSTKTTGNPVIDTINHYHNDPEHTLKKTAITDGIVEWFEDAQKPDIRANGNEIIENKLYISPAELINYLTTKYKCTKEQAEQLKEIFITRDFLTETTRLNTSNEDFNGAASTKYLMMLPETIVKYNS